MLAETPLTAALTPHQGMMLLEDCLGHFSDIPMGNEFLALWDVNQKLIEAHPPILAAINQGIYGLDRDFDYFAESYKLLTEARKADPAQFATAA